MHSMNSMNKQIYHGTELAVADCWMQYPDISVTLEGALSPRYG